MLWPAEHGECKDISAPYQISTVIGGRAHNVSYILCFKGCLENLSLHVEGVLKTFPTRTTPGWRSATKFTFKGWWSFKPHVHLIVVYKHQHHIFSTPRKLAVQKQLSAYLLSNDQLNLNLLTIVFLLENRGGFQNFLSSWILVETNLPTPIYRAGSTLFDPQTHGTKWQVPDMWPHASDPWFIIHQPNPYFVIFHPVSGDIPWIYHSVFVDPFTMRGAAPSERSMQGSICDDVNAIEIIRIQEREYAKNALFHWTCRFLAPWDSTVSFRLILLLSPNHWLLGPSVCLHH